MSDTPLTDLLAEQEDDTTPDELLLELIDLVTLAFPEPLYEMVVTFIPTPDGQHTALTDLDGKARAGQPKRPDLGFSDTEVLDGINGLLNGIADATERQAGIRVHHGRITLVEGSDREITASLFDASVKDADGHDELVMTRRFDRSELGWLFYTAPLFAALNGTVDDEHAQKLRVEQALVGTRTVQIDLTGGRITFEAPNAPPVPFGLELVGSFDDERRTFLWGWANTAVPPKVVQGVEKLRASSTTPGLRAFTETDFVCPEVMAERLARHAAVAMGAFGLYKAPFQSTKGKGSMYVALRTL